MTNLKFIETLIEEGKEEIELAKKIIAEDDKYHSIKKVNEENLKSMEELLAHLQQIKTELEAWEVVKKHCDYQDYDRFNCIQEGFYSIKLIKGKDFLTVKKALEVENAN